MTTARNIWGRLDGPLKVGFSFAILGIVLTLIGIFRDPTTPVTAWSIFMGSLISGSVWGLVSWAIATAAVEVEDDVRNAQSQEDAQPEPEQAAATAPSEQTDDSQ